MLLRSTIVFAAFITFTSAQITIDPSTVPLATRTQWCSAQFDTCEILCNQTHPYVNGCNATSLEYACGCFLDDTVSNLDLFIDTIPTFICEQLFSNCVSAEPDGQHECSVDGLGNCGTLNAVSYMMGSTSSAQATATISTTNVLTSVGVSSTTISTTPSSSGSSSGSTSSSSSAISSTSPSAGVLPHITVPPIAVSSSSSVVVPSSGGSSPNADGLSTGAKVGIAIGTVVGVFGLVLGGYLLARRGKEDLNTHPGTAELNNNGIHEIPQLETKERPGELKGYGLPDERVDEIG